MMKSPATRHDWDERTSAPELFLKHADTVFQSLFERSAEAPDVEGLGIYPGTVERFSHDARVPHMGWNTLTEVRPTKLLGGAVEPYVYFAHSYYVPEVPQTAATCTYTLPYTAVVEHRNVYGVQFHPEKSGPTGMEIVRRFIELC